MPLDERAGVEKRDVLGAVRAAKEVAALDAGADVDAVNENVGLLGAADVGAEEVGFEENAKPSNGFGFDGGSSPTFLDASDVDTAVGCARFVEAKTLEELAGREAGIVEGAELPPPNFLRCGHEI